MRRATMLAAAVGLAAVAAPAPAAGPTLGEIKVQLFYKNSSTLSANIAPPAKFDGWNTGAGEGDAKEPAEDLLVSIAIRPPAGSDQASFNETPLVLTARNAKGKVLATRTFKGILIPYTGQVVNPMWVQNAQCAGKVTITAVWGKQSKTSSVSLDCGE